MKHRFAVFFLLSPCLLLAEVQAQPLTDPTRPPTAAEVHAFFATHDREAAPAIDLRLQSVLISEQRRLAIINDRRVTEGDHIGSARVLRIEPGRVYLRDNGIDLTLTLSRERHHNPPNLIEQRHD